jgi:tetratricopeptide (TPR) repeat protein
MARAAIWVLLIGSGIRGAAAQTAQAPAQSQQPARKTCTVIKTPPNPAETALNKKEYSSAEGKFRELLAKDAKDDDAHGGLVRALIDQDKLADAAHEAEAWVASEPENSMAMTALGDLRLRQGRPREAFLQYKEAVHTDLCNARAYIGLAAVDGYAGARASRKQMIERAYSLHPSDDEIYTAWISTRQRTERLAKLTDYAEHSDQIDEDDRSKLKTRLEKESLYRASDCKAAPTSPAEAKVPMVAITDGPADSSPFLGWGLDVLFNGKRRRLQIDTGASGITISRAAAMFLGIQREDASSAQGIGDKGKVKTSIAHVASVKIGNIEFTNCAVEILEKWSVLDSDGLIGGDVFAASQLTLDFPKHELRIAPLPPRPDEKKPTASADKASDDSEPEPHDPYIAPDMAKWQRIYRSGHELLMPTGIVATKQMREDSAWKEKLFMLDSGAFSNLISPEAARDVTKVSRDYDTSIRGISGDVNHVFEAGKFTLAFANLRLDSPSMTAIDTTAISHDTGMEVSGLIGAPALFQIVLHIDYRDNLVLCEYTPKK